VRTPPAPPLRFEEPFADQTSRRTAKPLYREPGRRLPGAVERRPFAPGTRQIQAFYLMECDNIDAAVEWANRLPTYGLVEVRELIDY
jgi:hypothetical protein